MVRYLKFSAQLGLKLNTSATVNDAYSIGHYNGLNENVNQLLTSITEGWQVAPVVSFDEEAARAGLEAIAVEAGKPAQDASISLQGNEWVTTPAKIGYAINITNSCTLNANALRSWQMVISNSISCQLPLK
jgi:vancomycin resistance protein YoaR